MSGIYFRCRGCQTYRPRREFADRGGYCRTCDPPIKSKRCHACGLSKSIEHFHVDRHSRDGRRNECIPCRNADKRAAWRRQRDGRTQDRFNDDPVQRLIVSTWA